MPAAAGNGVLGMAVDAPGNVYVAAATFDPATSGVYKIARDGSFARLRGTEAIVFPNGVTLDKEGNVYVTDTILGRSGAFPQVELPLRSGFNRLFSRARGSSNSVSRLERMASRTGRTPSSWATPRGRLVRVEIEPDGSAGAISVLAEGLSLLGVDGIAFDVHETSGLRSSRRAPSFRCRPAEK